MAVIAKAARFDSDEGHLCVGEPGKGVIQHGQCLSHRRLACNSTERINPSFNVAR